MRAVSSLGAVVAALFLGACQPAPGQEAEIPQSFVALGVAQLSDDLAHAVDSGHTFEIADAWLGRTGLRCGVITLDGRSADTARFLVRKYGRPAQKVVTEQQPHWDAREWSAECSDRTAELLPDKA